MTPGVRLLLVRHGEVDANREFRYLGHTDPLLNGTGRRQAAALATSLSRIPIDLILSSPLRRTMETAVQIAGHRPGLAPRPEPLLLEMSFGDWEGLTRREVLDSGGDSASLLALWERDPGCAPPGGESLVAVRTRCLQLFDRLRHDHAQRTVVLVSHVGPIKAALCLALGLPLAASRRLFLDPATVTVIDWGPLTVVRLFNAPAGSRLERARWAQSPAASPP